MKTNRKTAKQKILELLVNAHQISVYWYQSQLPDGYLTTGHICHQNIGGSSAPRRVREMKAAGIDIDVKSFNGVTREGEKVHTWIYCLKTDPMLIDFKTGTLCEMEMA